MNKRIRLLCAAGDCDTLNGILEQLERKGLRVSRSADGPNKNETVLAVLSENFFADESLRAELLGLIGSGAENVLPLQLDSTPVPDEIMNALYSRNIISAGGRDDAQIAERIVSALPRKKSRLPLVLAAAGVLLLAIVGLLIWRGGQSAAEEAPSPAVTEPIRIEYDLPEGITAEDLAKIRCVVIIGEHLKVYNTSEKSEFVYPGLPWPEMLYILGSEDYNGEDEAEWYWNEDGTQASMTAYDLRFLSLLPNLEELHMALVDVTEAPDLSELGKLDVFWAHDCRLGDVRWLADSEIKEMHIRAHADLSPLSESKHLKRLSIDAYPDYGADFSDFSPQNLSHFDLWCHGVRDADLSGLARCNRLQELILSDVPVRDLSFIGSTMVREIELHTLNRLRDISALNNLVNLERLSIDDCSAIADFSPISSCTQLEYFRYCNWGNEMRMDGSFLEPLTRLNDVDLQNVVMNDLNFLYALAEHHNVMDFSITGSIADYSALAAFKTYGKLNIDPSDNASLTRIAPYLEGVTINNLALRRLTDPDLSLLPRVLNSLELDRCGMTDLSMLPDDYIVANVCLNKCSKLSSLEGLQKLSRFGKGGSGMLNIYMCTRLSDWSALNGMSMDALEITGGFMLPDLSAFRTKQLRLDSVADVTDLSFLDGMDASWSCSFRLVGLDVNNLMPLGRFRGDYLAVSPQLAEQAADLVEAGNFREYRVEYPQGGWEMDQNELKLQSMEELETLPPSMLRHVSSVTVAGDTIIDPELYDVWTDWNARGGPQVMIIDRSTGEESPLPKGNITDLSVFSELSGLRELRLINQPLKDLNGIQAFSELEVFEAYFCTELSDASALFTLQKLHEVSLNRSRIDSIRGVQNLPELRRLNVSDTKVSDLTPLAECDFSYAYGSGGLDLEINGLKLAEDDFLAVGTIERFSNLDFTDADPSVWIPALANSEIDNFGAAGDLRSNEDLAAFCADHPELRSIWIGWARITDLTPLLALENLRAVSLDRDMTDAIKSIEGQDYAFELNLN